ncbi:MAG: F0F1 ATP synthase subunit B [Oscillospiraceae bacterium]|jgi:F-type H+-transporting ATPase subunit b|nr:F0F1 ATP synthase subunit B [Oscillospiraceae bacterium]
MGGLFNPVSIAFHMINAAILGVALYKLLYKPVRAFMLGRQEMIRAKVDDADALMKRAEETREEIARITEEAERKAAGIITNSSQLAEARAVEILSRAQEEAERTARRAKDDADKMIIQAQETIRDQAGDLAVSMAEKLIGRGITREDHARLINDMIEGL